MELSAPLMITWMTGMHRFKVEGPDRTVEIDGSGALIVRKAGTVESVYGPASWHKLERL